MTTAAELVGAARSKTESVTPQQAAEELATGRAVALDVREPVEWEQHISGSYQIPRGLLEFVADPECGPILPDSLKFELDPDRRLITYCNPGARAALAALTLKQLGFDEAATIDGGLTAWREAGLPVAEHHAGI